MSLLKSVGGSNAPNQSGDTGVRDGSTGKDGYSVVDAPSQKPAMKNSDVTTTKEFAGSLGQQGTNLSAYEEQPATLSAETGK